MNNLQRLLSEALSVGKQTQLQAKPKPKVNVSALREQLRRLNVMYMAGNKTDDEYKEESEKINARIAQALEDAPPPEIDYSYFEELLKIDLKQVYSELSREDKQRMWRKLIKHIELDGPNVKYIQFNFD